MFKKRDVNIKSVGFKILYCNLEGERDTSSMSKKQVSSLKKYMEKERFRVIHIKRENKIARAVSEKLSDKRKKWVASKGYEPKGKLKVKIDTDVVKKNNRADKKARKKNSIKKLKILMYTKRAMKVCSEKEKMS